MSNWQLVTIPVPADITFTMPNGQQYVSSTAAAGNRASPLATADGSMPPSIAQWCDLRLAQQWLNEAKRLRDQIMAEKPDPIPTSGYRAQLTDQYTAQMNKINSLVNAVASYFNCLNIAWHTFLPVRRLYWKYFVTGTETLSPAEERSQYNRDGSIAGWYQSGDPFPIVDGSSRGLLTKQAWDLYRAHRGDASRIHFVPAVGLTLSLPAYTVNGTDHAPLQTLYEESALTNILMYQPDVTNQPFTIPGWQFALLSDADLSPYFGKCPTVTKPGYATQPVPLLFPNHCTDITPIALVPVPVPTSPAWIGDTEIPLGLDWRAFRFDNSIHLSGDPMKAYLGAYFYLPYFSEMIDVLSNWDAQQVILNAKQYTAFWNGRVLTGNGDIQSTLSTAFREAMSGDAGLMMAAGTVGAIGAALSGVTYGISAVVGAVGATALSIAARQPNLSKVGVGRDDLGRWKPALERGSLSGSPNITTQDGRPVLDVPSPGGGESLRLTPGQQALAQRLASRPQPALSHLIVSLPPELRPLGPQQAQTNVVDTNPTSMSSVVKIAAVGGVAFLAWKMYASKKTARKR